MNVPTSGADETSGMDVLGVVDVEGTAGSLDEDEAPVKGVRMGYSREVG